VEHGEWEPAASAQRGRHEARTQKAPGGAADLAIGALLAGLAAEVVVPWAVIWLSNVLIFDIPAWSLWLVFGVPAPLTFSAALILWVLRARRQAGPRQDSGR
jgi:hypothetical protein